MGRDRLEEICDRDAGIVDVHLMLAEQDRRELLAEVDALRKRAEAAEETLSEIMLLLAGRSDDEAIDRGVLLAYAKSHGATTALLAESEAKPK